MPRDESQTPEPPVRSPGETKPTVADPRDDLREQVATLRWDVQTFLTRRDRPRDGKGATRH